MSDSSPDIAGLTAEVTQILFLTRVLISGTALVLYDYVLTFSTEISEICNSKFSGAQALFILSRYPNMVFMVLYCAHTLTRNPSTTFCRAMFFNATAWVVMAQSGLYGILTLRTYAIYQKNQFIFVILGLPCLANVFVQVYGSVVEKSVIGSNGLAVVCGTDPSSTLWPRLRLAGIILSLIIDVLVFTLTFAKTIRHTIEMKRVGLGNGLGYFILRDGAMYFLAKLLFGVVSAIVFFAPASASIGNWLTVVNNLSNPLTIILINRLVLNLRQVSHLKTGNASTLGAIDTIQEPAFATNSLLGNIGAPLRVGPEEDYDDDEIEDIRVDAEVGVVDTRGTVNHTERIEVSRNPSQCQMQQR